MIRSSRLAPALGVTRQRPPHRTLSARLSSAITVVDLPTVAPASGEELPGPMIASAVGLSRVRERTQGTRPPPRPGASESKPRASGHAPTHSGEPEVRDPLLPLDRPTRVASRQTDSGLEAQHQALHLDEVERARAWATMTFFLPLSCLLLLPSLDAPPGASAMYAASLCYMMAVSVFVWVRTRQPADYTPAVFRFFGYSAASVSFVIEYFLGVFSPAPLVVTLGLSFYGTGRDKKHAICISAYTITGYFVLLVLTTFGVIDDVGQISAVDADVATRMTFLILCPLVLIATVAMARVMRRSADESMTRYHLAAALAEEHEAQLLEANRELEHALKLGAGQSGSFTGGYAGRFKLGSVIGRGGMGVVYAAVDPRTGEQAAVKVLKITQDEDPTDYLRFLREGRIAGSLDLDHVVRIYDCGRLQDFNIPYIAMERLRGVELASLLRKRSRMPVNEVAELARHLGRGLDGAHGVGIVHRDLKPRNIFLCDDTERWKILDFGVCKKSNSQGTLTGLNQIIGTPSYMSPEQAQGRHVDHRSDVFALGCVLYRAVTGRPPFNGHDIASVVYEIVYRHPERPSHIVSELTGDIDRVLVIALSKDRAGRFNSAGELAAAFVAAIEGKLSQSRRSQGDKMLAASRGTQLRTPERSPALAGDPTGS